MRRALIVLLALGMGVLTLAVILIAVPLAGAWFFWISGQGWSKPVTYMVFLLPFLPILAALFVLELCGGEID